MAARTLSVQNARRPVYHAAPCSSSLPGRSPLIPSRSDQTPERRRPRPPFTAGPGLPPTLRPTAAESAIRWLLCWAS